MTETINHPPEIQRLLNPAFCGAMLWLAVKNYHMSRKEGMPLALSFLILPLVAHGPSRYAMPKDRRTLIHLWVMRHPEVRVGFRDRCEALLPYTTNGLEYLLDRSVIRFSRLGELLPGTGQPKSEVKLEKASVDVGLCCRKSKLVGNWFADVPRVAMIYMLFGVRP